MMLVGLAMAIVIALIIWFIAKKMCDPVVALREECLALAGKDLRSIRWRLRRMIGRFG